MLLADTYAPRKIIHCQDGESEYPSNILECPWTFDTLDHKILIDKLQHYTIMV